MTAKKDLQYLTTVLDGGGPRSPSEMSQIIVVVRRLAQRINELEAEAAKSDSTEALEELQAMHVALKASHDLLEKEVARKKVENRTLKSKVTRLEKKVRTDEDAS